MKVGGVTKVMDLMRVGQDQTAMIALMVWKTRKSTYTLDRILLKIQEDGSLAITMEEAAALGDQILSRKVGLEVGV
jgi:hypothetical protein